MPFERLQQRIRYTFGDRAVLLQSLTHKSFGHEYFQNKPVAHRDNERLEFLGDAILDVIISDILLELFPDANEGHLSKMRAAVVNEKTLSELAKSIHIQDCLRLGKGETQTNGKAKASILASAFEALIAAIYLDGGFNAVYPVVRHIFVPLLAQENELRAFYDHKTQLQELVQARWKVTPTYHLLESHGPDHAKVFEIEVRMNGKPLAVAKGFSKKEAEQNAARTAILSVE
ncbi:MAG: ribonuclease III [Bdellovibrionia bacterium]